MSDTSVRSTPKPPAKPAKPAQKPPIKRAPQSNANAAKQASTKRASLMITAGVMDFAGAVAGFVVVVALVSLLVIMLGWLRQDVTQTVSSFSDNFNAAIITASDVNIP